MLVVGVLQADAEADPLAAAASLPGARVVVLRAAAVTLPAIDGVEVLVGAPEDRAAAAVQVRARCGEARIVILRAEERASAELAAELTHADAVAASPRAYRAPVRLRFLEREVAMPAVDVAWDGDPTKPDRTVECCGPLHAQAGTLGAMVTALDAHATREAARRPRVSAGDFLWRPGWRLLGRLYRRRRHGVPGLILAVMETYGEILIAAKVWERARARETERVAPPGFGIRESSTGFTISRADLGAELERIVLAATPEHVEGERLTGAGRGAVWMVRAAGGPAAVLRWYRRGGVPGRFVRDRFVAGRVPRPVRELLVTEEARARGIPVPEILAVRVDGAGVGRYRGAIVTREFEGGIPFGVYLGVASPSAAAAAARTVAAVVRCMHDRGLDHPDLNAGNLLVRPAPDGLAVCIIDLDRARVRASVSAWRRRRALARLARSLADPEARATLQRAYWEAG